MRLRRLLPATLVALTVAACAGSPAASPGASPAAATSAPAVELQVYAAASLQSALVRAAAAYEAENPGLTITASTDSSAALETKIEQGAPADVFLSADTANPQKLVAAGLAAGAVSVFAGNQLTVIVPTANPAGIASPADLARSGVKIVACSDAVPIEKYTVQWLAKVSALPAYGADFATRFDANVVSREDSVSAIVAKVGLGEGDAGIVYVTDARTTTQVATVGIPAAENVPASYGGVVVRASAHAAAAAKFLGWLTGAEGQRVLASFGFLPPAG